MNRAELNLLLAKEKNLYLGQSNAEKKRSKRSKHKRYYIWKYLYYFRLCQFYRELRTERSIGRFSKSLAKHKFKYYEKKKNIYSYKSGVEIGLNSKIGMMCDIWHGGVVINGEIGNNCVFHTVGNKGFGREKETPVLGNNVDVGCGSSIIGGVHIADSCVVGAGSVVTKSVEKPRSIVVGIPGKPLVNKNNG